MRQREVNPYKNLIINWGGTAVIKAFQDNETHSISTAQTD